MASRRTISYIGLWALILPWLGLSWETKSVLFSLTGVLLLIIGNRYYFTKRQKDLQQKEPAPALQPNPNPMPTREPVMHALPAEEPAKQPPMYAALDIPVATPISAEKSRIARPRKKVEMVTTRVRTAKPLGEFSFDNNDEQHPI